MDEKSLTPRQRGLLHDLRQRGFLEYRAAFGRSQRNGPIRKLVELGFADNAWVPPGYWLQVQGVIPRRPVPDVE